MNSNISDLFRKEIVNKLDTILDDVILSRKFEQSLYNYIIKLSLKNNILRNWENDIFKTLYLQKIISFYNNINKKSYVENLDFLDRIKSGEINPNNITKLHLYDIHPNNWKDLINKKLKYDEVRNNLKPEAMTSLFKCNKCNSRECSYYEVQTRSADEPMTQFITCLKCYSRWRQ